MKQKEPKIPYRTEKLIAKSSLSEAEKIELSEYILLQLKKLNAMGNQLYTALQEETP